MSVKSWLLLILALLLLFPFRAAAEEIPESSEQETVETQPEETEASDGSDEETTVPSETVPAPTIAPFDWYTVEESVVQTVDRLDQVVQLLSGMMFFLGVCAGIHFFQVLSGRIRTV